MSKLGRGPFPSSGGYLSWRLMTSQLRRTWFLTNKTNKKSETQATVWGSLSERGEGQVEEGKGGQMHGDRRRLDFGW